MAPGFVEIIPLYLIFKNIGLLGSPIALVFAHVYVNLAFVIWLMKGFFDEITVDLDERAMIDGASRIRAFFQLILPLTLPGLVTTAIFVLIFSWNEFLFALILTGGLSRTLPVAIPGLVTPAGTYWGEVMAVATVITVPILIFATAVRKYLVRGLTFGAVK
jgi:multiple sugar transport system permease protein